jgi:tRNA threonylcarbamoyladenosine biosynthesis protein TsaE
MRRYVTTSAEETRALAAALACELRAGDVVVLAGELGAGKTTFAQGIARGLGVEEPVTSPSFTLVQEYRGRLPVAHVDVYRLDRLQELHDLGFEELVDGGGVTIVEWGDVVEQLMPPDRVVIRLQPGAGDDDRIVGLEIAGASWRARAEALVRTLEPFESTGSPSC